LQKKRTKDYTQGGVPLHAKNNLLHISGGIITYGEGFVKVYWEIENKFKINSKFCE
jgi:hypothetical protein